MIPLPREPKITKKEKNKATFEMEALYPGYGITIGNSLRRVLISSLEGVAVTQVKIKGVSHEFSTIPGVKEDVINILLNLKQLRFKMFSEEAQKAVLKVKGEKEVKGSDLELPTQLELVNKDALIATITDKKGELEMEILIEKGVGFVTTESRQKEKLDVGVILVDAIFTPIRNVAFKAENMRVGKRTDFDRLSLEVETDGTISPETAFGMASETLCKHFELFCGTFPSEKKEEAEGKKEGKKKKEKKGKKGKTAKKSSKKK